MEAGACYVNDIDKATELRLGLPGTEPEKQLAPPAGRGSKRALPEDDEEELIRSSTGGDKSTGTGRGHECAPPPAKAQIVGWPPVRSCRKNNFQAKTKVDRAEAAAGAGHLVKVGMDGAPYLRKLDLKAYKGYKELREALDAMFKCFVFGNNKERCNMDYAITYEDKDGDWMLVGDVPWEMFICSCKRLRIMKGSEARGHGTTGRS